MSSRYSWVLCFPVITLSPLFFRTGNSHWSVIQYFWLAFLLGTSSKGSLLIITFFVQLFYFLQYVDYIKRNIVFLESRNLLNESFHFSDSTFHIKFPRYYYFTTRANLKFSSNFTVSKKLFLKKKKIIYYHLDEQP